MGDEMRLRTEQQEIVRRLLENQTASFSDLAEIAGLDKRTAFIGANLRNVDFGRSDLSGFNFARSDLTGADLSQATGKDRLVLTGAITNRARGLPVRTDETQDAPDFPKLVRIPAGTFLMGTPAAENRREEASKEFVNRSTPPRPITIVRPYWLGKYPVTRGQFAAFVDDTGYRVPTEAWTNEPDEDGKWKYRPRANRSWRDPGFEQTDEHPVVCVSHEDASAYVKWLSVRSRHEYRLPSESEWEYAARAGTTTARFWGDGREQAPRFAQVANRAMARLMGGGFDPKLFYDCDSGYAFTAPVGTFLPNPYGLFDILGNTWEWVADRWAETLATYPSDGSPNRVGKTILRAMRGGSRRGDLGGVRCGTRYRDVAKYRYYNVGFRVARSLAGTET